MKKIFIPENIMVVLTALLSAGAVRILLVGGAVLDFLQGREIKDWDFEVYGLEYPQMETILEGMGKISVCGKAFGIIKVSLDDADLDISMPRGESKVGEGHKGFEVVCDSNLTVEQASVRRDLTINALAYDIISHEIHDYFGGLKDLETGTMKMVRRATFMEDSLRPLRVMQLLARKGKVVDHETMKTCRDMQAAGAYSELPQERVYEEFYKLLMKSDKPSLGLEFLRESGWIRNFPELETMVGCAQNPEHHPEGDVWVHTQLVVDYAASLRGEIDREWQEAFMWAALLHDCGKPATTDPVTLAAYGHAEAGVEPARKFMERVTREKDLIKKVLTLVKLHMRVSALYRDGAGEGAWRKLHAKFPRLDILGAFTEADGCSRPGFEKPADGYPDRVLAMEYMAKFGAVKPFPILTGKDLMAAGYPANVREVAQQFGPALKAAFEAQINEGVEDKEKLLEIAKSLIKV